MDDKKRCQWCVGDPLYEAYHDHEWGVPIHDDQLLFEFLTLETFQAGLSWITILRKRENFRSSFDSFDYRRIAHYNEDKIQDLIQDARIIRNQKKIRATVNNAQRFMEIQKSHGSFSSYIWDFVGNTPVQNSYTKESEIPVTTDIATNLSRDLKKRGFQFVGPTVVYAHMQATGMVNDHTTACFRYEEIKAIR